MPPLLQLVALFSLYLQITSTAQSLDFDAPNPSRPSMGGFGGCADCYTGSEFPLSTNKNSPRCAKIKGSTL